MLDFPEAGQLFVQAKYSSLLPLGVCIAAKMWSMTLPHLGRRTSVSASSRMARLT
jgi:hypothetical protein